jgi:hypothetical protein
MTTKECLFLILMLVYMKRNWYKNKQQYCQQCGIMNLLQMKHPFFSGLYYLRKNTALTRFKIIAPSYAAYFNRLFSNYNESL